jgi:hypothetical protein
MKMEGEEYTCCQCGEVYLKTRPDGEAMAEFEELFPNETEPAIVCDDCWQAMREKGLF